MNPAREKALSMLASMQGAGPLLQRLPGGKIGPAFTKQVERKEYPIDPGFIPGFKLSTPLPVVAENPDIKEKKVHPGDEDDGEVIDLPEKPPVLKREVRDISRLDDPSDEIIEEFLESIPEEIWEDMKLQILETGTIEKREYLDWEFTQKELGYCFDALFEEIQEEDLEAIEEDEEQSHGAVAPVVEEKQQHVIVPTGLQPSTDTVDEDWPEEDAEEELKGPVWLKDSKWETKENFRLSNQRLFLTYKHHLPKKQLEKLLCDLAKAHKNYAGKPEIYIAHEVGKTGYKHTHVYIDWKFLFTSTKNVRILDISFNGENIHPNVKVVSGEKSVPRTLSYISKQDPELAELKAKYGKKKISFLQQLENCESERDVVRSAKHPSEVAGRLRAFEYIKKPNEFKDPFEGRSLRPWQQWLVERVSGPVPWGNRCMQWIVDHQGRSGKSMLKQYFQYLNSKNKRCDYAYVLGGKSIDISTQIYNWRTKQGWNGKAIIFDLPRQSEDRNSDIYTVIEETLNGDINSQKYNSEIRSLNTPPWVVVFSNYTPKVYIHGKPTMTMDRWSEVWEITWDYISKPEGPCTASTDLKLSPGTPSQAKPADMSRLNIKSIVDGSKNKVQLYYDFIEKRMKQGLEKRELAAIKQKWEEAPEFQEDDWETAWKMYYGDDYRFTVPIDYTKETARACKKTQEEQEAAYARMDAAAFKGRMEKIDSFLEKAGMKKDRIEKTE